MATDTRGAAACLAFGFSSPCAEACDWATSRLRLSTSAKKRIGRSMRRAPHLYLGRHIGDAGWEGHGHGLLEGTVSHSCPTTPSRATNPCLSYSYTSAVKLLPRVLPVSSHTTLFMLMPLLAIDSPPTPSWLSDIALAVSAFALCARASLRQPPPAVVFRKILAKSLRLKLVTWQTLHCDERRDVSVASPSRFMVLILLLGTTRDLMAPSRL
ncbi:hypothetical protein FB45DRAFT_1036483 [Roridomyces roridus]|uniref:Uncharacterized protein n=1 Tax=Roridomyces roridus TaxID=1738132 RepID=A0AAD7B8X5_9AGAR|nr:hypothetical protein FB45DRAFT_1036483 [Roridomyces roridus]